MSDLPDELPSDPAELRHGANPERRDQRSDARVLLPGPGQLPVDRDATLLEELGRPHDGLESVQWDVLPVEEDPERRVDGRSPGPPG